MTYLKEQGFEITYLRVDKDGIIDLEQLQREVREDTILVSIMMVNNEMGALEPIEEAVKIIHEKNPAVLIHVDAIQAYGKFKIVPKRMGIDLISVSGHKIHGPKGIGFLYIREKTKIKSISYGGGQQKGMRSGTMNTPGIAGLGLAAKEAYENFEEKMDRLYELKQFFAEEAAKIEGAHVNGRTGRDSAPHIVSVSFEGIRSEVLLHALEDKGIYVSAGSACASHHPSESNTLHSIGLPAALQESTIRFSFCTHTTKEELEYTLQALKELVPTLRKYRRH